MLNSPKEAEENMCAYEHPTQAFQVKSQMSSPQTIKMVANRMVKEIMPALFLKKRPTFCFDQGSAGVKQKQGNWCRAVEKECRVSKRHAKSA